MRDRFERLTAADEVNCKLVLPDGGKIWFKATLTHPNNNNRWSFTLHAIVDPYGQTTSIWYGTWDNRPIMTIQEPVQGPTGRWLHILYRTITDTSQGHYGDVVVDRVEASDGRVVSYGYQAYVTPNGTRYTSLHQVRHFGAQWWDSFYSYQNSNGRYPDGTPNPNDRPLIKTCIDPLFDGPMWMIAYSFPVADVYGKLQSEKYYDGQNIGAAVSTINNPSQYVRTETRGDNPEGTGSPQRTFTYNGTSNSPTYGLWKVTDFKNVIARQTYNSSTGFLATSTDRENNTTTYQCKWKGGVITNITSATPVNVIPPGTPTVIQYRYAGDGGCTDPNNTDSDNPYYVCKVDNGPSYERFSSSKQIKKITYPATVAGTATEEFTYNQFGQVLTHKMRNGYTESWTYDPNNPSRVSEYRDGEHQNPGHPTAWYQYNSLGRVSGITDGNGASSGDPAHTTTFQYNPPGQLTRVTHPDGSYIQYFYWANRALMATTDERHPTTTDPDQATVYFQDNYKRLRAVITPKRSGNNPLPRTTTYYYDQNGVGDDYTRTADVPTKVVSPGGKVVRTTYDNNLRSHIVTVVGVPPVVDAVTTYGYDANGNVLTVQDPNNHTTTYYYDALDRVKYIKDATNCALGCNSDGYTMSFWYDPSGNLKQQKRADNKTCIFEYNPMGFMKDRLGYQSEHTTYVPDLAGNLVDYKFEKADGTWITYHYDYDKVNRLKQVTYPKDVANVKRNEQYEYDIANHLWHYWNADGKKKTLTYDARGRLTDTVWDNNVAPNLHIQYDVASRPTYITSTNGTRIDFGFDEANNRISETQTVPGTSGNIVRVVQSDPDADGNRANLLVKTGSTINFANYFDYTSRNELLNINDSNHNGFFTYSYDAAGNVTKRQRQGWSDRVELPNYDALNRPQHCKQYDHGGNLFDTIDYNYTKIGNLKNTVRSDYGGGKGDWFGYDEINQLGTAVYKATGLDTPDTPAARVTYDCGNRNRKGMTVDDYVNNRHYSVTFNPVDLNQYSSITVQGTLEGYDPQFVPDLPDLALTWDHNFNLETFNGWSYTYDGENRLISVSGHGHSVTLTYDPMGRCVKRMIDGTDASHTRIYTYDQWTGVTEWNGTGGLVATNVFGLGDDEILYRNTGSAEYYYKSDAMGNVKFLLDGNGAGLEKYNYDAFGFATITNWDGSNPRYVSNYGNRFAFGGREYFNEMALYDMRNRVYDPVMGRFYQTDPIGLQGDPLNLYRFCGNNPLLGGDPMGTQDAVDASLFDDGDSLPSEQPQPFEFTFSAPLGGWGPAATQPIIDDFFNPAESSSTTTDDFFFESTGGPFALQAPGVSLRRNVRVATGPDIMTAHGWINIGLSSVSTTYTASGYGGISADAPLGDMILISGGLKLLSIAESAIGARTGAAAAAQRRIAVIGGRDDVARYAGNPSRFNVFRPAENLTTQEIDRANGQWMNSVVRGGDEIWAVTHPEKHAEFLKSLPSSIRAFEKSNYLHVELPMLEQYEAVAPIIKY